MDFLNDFFRAYRRCYHWEGFCMFCHFWREIHDFLDWTLNLQKLDKTLSKLWKKKTSTRKKLKNFYLKKLQIFDEFNFFPATFFSDMF